MESARRKVIFSISLLLIVVSGLVAVTLIKKYNFPRNGSTTFDRLLVQGDRVVFTNLDLPRMFYGRFHGSLWISRDKVTINSSPDVTCPLNAKFTFGRNYKRSVVINLGPEGMAAWLELYLNNRENIFFSVDCTNGCPHIFGLGLKTGKESGN